jgi:hypothetical protein
VLPPPVTRERKAKKMAKRGDWVSQEGGSGEMDGAGLLDVKFLSCRGQQPSFPTFLVYI